MSEYKFEVGREYKTRNGRRCVIVANDPDVGMVWKVEQRDGRGWWMQIDNSSCTVNGNANDPLYPVPPERTVDQWQVINPGEQLRVLCTTNPTPITTRVRWTIGSDGRPAYAVRLDENGEPMYRVEPVTKGGGDA